MNQRQSSLLAAYRHSAYLVGVVVVRIGRRSAALDALFRREGAREAVLIAAWNPFSRRMPRGWNRRMDARLWEHIRRHRWLPATGGTGIWWEEHILLFGDCRPAIVLARRFRQRAVVLLRQGQPARLHLLTPLPA